MKKTEGMKREQRQNLCVKMENEEEEFDSKVSEKGQTYITPPQKK